MSGPLFSLKPHSGARSLLKPETIGLFLARHLKWTLSE